MSSDLTTGGSQADAQVLKNLGNQALSLGDLEQAESLYRQAIAADDRFMPAYYNLGNVLRLDRRYDEALAAYQVAAALAPDDYDIHVNIGVTLNELARHGEALQSFATANSLNPAGLEARINTGVALSRAGRHEEAIRAYSEILATDPTVSLARYFRSLEFLIRANWAEGFLDHEARLDLAGVVPEELLAGKEEWDGSDLAGRTLLIYPEQRMGDALQFLRYAPLCRARGARVMVCCHPPLQRLLATSPDIDVVFADGTPVPEAFDTYISVMSLGYVFGRAPELAPLRLQVPASRSDEVSGTGFKVGICHRGDPGHIRDAERSIPEETFWRHLAHVPGVDYYSFQLDELSERYATPLAPFLSDFLDTAMLASQMDLILTVDTSLAHLGGTIGTPTWVMVTHSPDWRWGESGETTPWYPGIRILRQPSAGDWDAVLAEAAIRIRKMLPATAG